ncbi:MAG: UDP-N-acetylmuramoyl-L-alanine--D-glutamate ligase [Gammaproteobacteria bacterium]
MPNPTRRTALVVGLGLTGLSCVRYLVAQGYDVRVADTRAAPPQLNAVKQAYPELPIRTGAFDPAWFRQAQLVCISPGVSMAEPAVQAAIAAGAEIVGDIELFARAAKAPVLAITGSNGKSTVTSLVGKICEAAKLDTRVGGNIGVAALSLLAPKEPDVYVLELSSFQLETTSSLNARASCVLNITPDHMDRYPSLAAYAAAKARIYAGDGAMVLNADDPIVMRMRRPGRDTVCFGLSPLQRCDDYILREHAGESWLMCGAEPILPTREVPLPGRHNLANVLAALALTDAMQVPRAAQIAAIRAFRGLPHRTELVAERDGVRWINDSKGTNVGATVAALSGMTAPVVLIAGGDGKGADFGDLKPACARHARAVVLIGRDAPLIETALAGAVPSVYASDMRDAVIKARALARSGDLVLLSPACASFDMFRNYEHRGDVFRAAVEEVLR